MKNYYYVNLNDSEITRVEGNTIIVSLQRGGFEKIKLCSANFNSTSNFKCPVVRLNTFSGNGFSSNRKGVVMGFLQNLIVSGSDYIYSLNSEGQTYFISETLHEISITLIDSNGDELLPANIQNFHFMLELTSV
jgi:hypothetical protein